MPRFVRPLPLAILLACVATGACQDRPAEADLSSAVSTESPEPTVVAPYSAPVARPPADGCIKGGTPRAEVQALLGAPDSISWGVWLYGRSEVTFGYGVVVAYEDRDGNLSIC